MEPKDLYEARKAELAEHWDRIREIRIALDEYEQAVSEADTLNRWAGVDESTRAHALRQIAKPSNRFRDW